MKSVVVRGLIPRVVVCPILDTAYASRARFDAGCKLRIVVDPRSQYSTSRVSIEHLASSIELTTNPGNSQADSLRPCAMSPVLSILRPPMIHRTPFIFPLLYPSLIWRMPGHSKELYLTFDDGPVTGPTEFALHTLSRYDAQATFFCIGDNIRKHPHVFQKVVEEGHAIGNHTFNHLNGWGTDNQKYVDNTALCEKAISNGLSNTSATRKGHPLFRPPYGRISRKQIKLLSDYKIIMWDVLSIDYSKHLSPESCLRNTINACRPGSIIVFHDSYKAEKNMSYTLPRLLEHFSERGYAFKSISL